jgi:outer membrane receptor protein involved in Fe transport
MLDGKYYDYKTFEEAKPWHMPDFKIGLDASYNFGSKFTAGLEFTLTGNRWVRNYSLPEDMDKFKPVADINLSLNYHFSKLFTLFADFYNLTGRSYMIWNQYPSQRFNFLFGFSYKL